MRKVIKKWHLGFEALAVCVALYAFGCGKGSVDFRENPSQNPASISEAPEVNSYETRLRSAGRFYVYSSMKDVFAVDDIADDEFKAIVDSALQLWILTNMSSFGSPCDPNNVIPISGAESEDDYADRISSECPRTLINGALRIVQGPQQMDTVAPAMTSRWAWVTRTCDALSNVDSIMEGAISKIGYDFYTRPTEAALSAAFEAFYVGHTAPETVVSSLKNLADSSQSAEEAWRFVWISLCYSPGWQIP